MIKGVDDSGRVDNKAWGLSPLHDSLLLHKSPATVDLSSFQINFLEVHNPYQMTEISQDIIRLLTIWAKKMRNHLHEYYFIQNNGF